MMFENENTHIPEIVGGGVQKRTSKTIYRRKEDAIKRG